jgi:hypothetical protein
MEIEHKLRERLTGSPRWAAFLTCFAIIWHRISYWLFLSDSVIHEWTPGCICFLFRDSSRVHCTLSDFLLVFCIKYLCLWHCVYLHVLVFTKKLFICFSPSRFHCCIPKLLKSRWVLYSTPFLLLLFFPSSTSSIFRCLQEILPKMYFQSFACSMMT